MRKLDELGLTFKKPEESDDFDLVGNFEILENIETVEITNSRLVFKRNKNIEIDVADALWKKQHFICNLSDDKSKTCFKRKDKYKKY